MSDQFPVYILYEYNLTSDHVTVNLTHLGTYKIGLQFALTFSFIFAQGIGVEMERLAAKMGGTVKWPYNDSECLDAEFFKVKSIWTRKCI